MTTVFACTGALAPPLKASWWRGQLWSKATRVDINYALPGALVPVPNLATAERCAEMVDAALHATAGPKVVAGHSLGAQGGVYKWLRDYGPTSDINPADVVFISSGNPERKYNGIMRVPGALVASVEYGGLGLPEDTPYTVWDIAKQYDFFADHPNDLTNTSSMKNIAPLGVFLAFFEVGNLVHSKYDTAGITESTNVKFVEGNVTYITVPNTPLVSSLNPRAIEAGYTRPAPVTPLGAAPKKPPRR